MNGERAEREPGVWRLCMPLAKSRVRAPGQRVKGASPTPEGDSLLDLVGPKDGQNLQT